MGIVVDSSVLIAAERRDMTPSEAIRTVRQFIGDFPVILSCITVAEIGHGIYRSQNQETRVRRRQFLDELKATVPIHPITESTAEIAARVGGEQAARGINLPLADLLIGAAALELGYAVATSNRRDFRRIPGLSIVDL